MSETQLWSSFQLMPRLHMHLEMDHTASGYMPRLCLVSPLHQREQNMQMFRQVLDLICDEKTAKWFGI